MIYTKKLNRQEKKLMGYIYNNAVDKIEVHDNDEEEENEHIKMYEEDDNNSPHKNQEDEYEDGEKNYYISISLLFIIF
jgi:hypothetical protein